MLVKAIEQQKKQAVSILYFQLYMYVCRFSVASHFVKISFH